VNQLGHDQDMPSCLTFGDRYGMSLPDDDNDSNVSNGSCGANDSTHVSSSNGDDADNDNDGGSDPDDDSTYVLSSDDGDDPSYPYDDHSLSGSDLSNSDDDDPDPDNDSGLHSGSDDDVGSVSLSKHQMVTFI